MGPHRAFPRTPMRASRVGRADGRRASSDPLLSSDPNESKRSPSAGGSIPPLIYNISIHGIDPLQVALLCARLFGGGPDAPPPGRSFRILGVPRCNLARGQPGLVGGEQLCAWAEILFGFASVPWFVSCLLQLAPWRVRELPAGRAGPCAQPNHRAPGRAGLRAAALKRSASQ